MFYLLKHGLRTLIGALLAVIVLLSGFGDFRPTSLELAVAPYRYNLVGWEIGNLPDKWGRKLLDVLPGVSSPSREQGIAQTREFFRLGQEYVSLERQRLFPQAAARTASPQVDLQAIQEEIDRTRRSQRQLQAVAEETLEAEVSAVLAEEGLGSLGGLIFPPVDAVYSGTPHVLALSPRDRIDRLRTIPLRPDMTEVEKEALEERILREEGLSPLVEKTGGLATYPSIVADTGGLHYAVVTTAHEWLHQWFFFLPLGRNFWSNPEMTTLNETAATMAGREIGDRAFAAITGQTVEREVSPAPPSDPDAFDFNAAMRETRLEAESLLDRGKVEEAEAYMEERRLFLADNGYFIRKLNQAFFAFHGSYATSPASTSPIAGQLQKLRDRSGSLEEFLRTVSGFGSYDEFVAHLEALGETDAVPR